MKNHFYILVIIISLCACKGEKEIDKFSPKIDQLAKRYLELGRFSGTILVAKKDQILFNQSYGFADYENSIPFSDTCIFKVEPLGELFTEQVIKQLNVKQEDYDNLPTIVEQYCTKHGLKHTFYQRANTKLIEGYLYHNYRGQGIELEKISNTGKEKRLDSIWLKSTTLDLLKFARLLREPIIQKSGFMSGSGFSSTLQKNEDLTIIILSNRRHPIGGEMAIAIQAIYKNEPYELPLPRTPFDANTSLYSNYTGTYEVNPGFSFEVISRNDSLFTLMRGRETHAISQSDNQFYYQDFDAAIKFVRDSNQVISSAILYNGFLEGNEVLKIKS